MSARVVCLAGEVDLEPCVEGQSPAVALVASWGRRVAGAEVVVLSPSDCRALANALFVAARELDSAKRAARAPVEAPPAFDAADYARPVVKGGGR